MTLTISVLTCSEAKEGALTAGVMTNDGTELSLLVNDYSPPAINCKSNCIR
jgi:hypothetical protein